MTDNDWIKIWLEVIVPIVSTLAIVPWLFKAFPRLIKPPIRFFWYFLYPKKLLKSQINSNKNEFLANQVYTEISSDRVDASRLLSIVYTSVILIIVSLFFI